MSKERARRRAEREREQAIRTAARARADERLRRRSTRRRALLGWLPQPHWQPGLLARRRRRQVATTIGLLVVGNALVWFASPAWEIRIVMAMVSLLAAPVLHTLLFRRK